jgi:hypothetical protein
LPKILEKNKGRKYKISQKGNENLSMKQPKNTTIT